MSFTLLPAIDVSAGRIARVDHGAAGDRLDDPLASARAWQADGAEWIHLVDLDAAFGRGTNADVLSTVIAGVDVHVEWSGGVVDDASLAVALASGAERVVLGTAALVDPDWCTRVVGTHGERIVMGLDVRIVDGSDGRARHRLAARGGGDEVGDLWETVARLDEAGCAGYVVTEAARDGRMSGPDLNLYRRMISATSRPVFASGGVGSIDDLAALAGIVVGGNRIAGAVVGRALLAGRFGLPDAIATMRRIGR